MRSIFCLLLLSLAALAGCIPYSVGTTARPVASSTPAVSASVTFVPVEPAYLYEDGEAQASAEATPTGLLLLDTELRGRIDARSEASVRITSLSGFSATYKRLLAGAASPSDPALALIAGGGVVNAGNHAFGEVTLLASGSEAGLLTPYGGARVMHVLPLSREAIRDTPTLGLFAGMRLGTVDFGISPEVGVFYDESALGLRDRRVIVVPSVTLHGANLLRMMLR